MPPVFVDDGATSTATVVVRENQNLTLSCRAQGFPTPKIAWKREDGMDIVLNKKIKGNLKLTFFKCKNSNKKRSTLYRSFCFFLFKRKINFLFFN